MTKSVQHPSGIMVLAHGEVKPEDRSGDTKADREIETMRRASRYEARAAALERAVDAAASDGIPRDKLHAWLAGNGWTMSDDDGVFVWRRGDDEFITFGDYAGLITLLRDVKYLAIIHGRSLADVLEEIMVPS